MKLRWWKCHLTNTLQKMSKKTYTPSVIRRAARPRSPRLIGNRTGAPLTGISNSESTPQFWRLENGNLVTDNQVLIKNNLIVQGDTASAGAGEYTEADSIPDRHYVHTQLSASKEWLVNHNLGKFPSVTVVDSAQTVVIGEVTYIDSNNLKITFSAEFGGTAYLN